MADENTFIGKQLGNYRLVAELNSGSYGSVYQGKHLIFEDDPVVAIKVLHAHLGSSQERTQFIQEAQLLKKLQHPHILPILDAGIQDGFPYMVTAYASQGSLRDRLDQQPHAPFPLDEALRILSQVSQALHFAHQQRIVHRDLKPGNILFNAQGEALLADFGIAAVLATARTRQLGRGGTPAYMAPEQFEGMVSMKSDQYALGCLAYELVTGHKPFTVANGSLEVWWYQHAKVEPVAPTQLNPGLPIHIEEAILKAMTKQRTGRHTDVAAFLSSLQKSAQQWFEEGNTLSKLQHFEEAITAYDQAIGLNPSYADTYYNKGTALLTLKRAEEDIATYDQVIRLNPSHATAYYNKGLALSELQRVEEAITAYDQAVGLDPSHATAYYNKGLALSELQRFEEAITAYDQYLLLNPSNVDAYINKGYALEKLGKQI